MKSPCKMFVTVCKPWRFLRECRDLQLVSKHLFHTEESHPNPPHLQLHTHTHTPIHRWLPAACKSPRALCRNVHVAQWPHCAMIWLVWASLCGKVSPVPPMPKGWQSQRYVNQHSEHTEMNSAEWETHAYTCKDPLTLNVSLFLSTAEWLLDYWCLNKVGHNVVSQVLKTIINTTQQGKQIICLLWKLFCQHTV